MVIKKSFLAAQLALAIFMLMLLSSPARATENYIEGLSIQLEDYPNEIRVGETFTMTVRAVNQSGQQIDALLRTYLYGYQGEISYPQPDFRKIVLLNEGGWYPNEVPVNLAENENKTFALSLTIKSDIQLANGVSAPVKLRTRISRIENGTYVNIAPPDNHYITLLSEAGPEGIVGIKFGVGVAVAVTIVYSVAAIQNRNNMIARRRARMK